MTPDVECQCADCLGFTEYDAMLAELNDGLDLPWNFDGDIAELF